MWNCQSAYTEIETTNWGICSSVWIHANGIQPHHRTIRYSIGLICWIRCDRRATSPTLSGRHPHFQPRQPIIWLMPNWRNKTAMLHRNIKEIKRQFLEPDSKTAEPTTHMERRDLWQRKPTVSYLIRAQVLTVTNIVCFFFAGFWFLVLAAPLLCSAFFCTHYSVRL